MPGWSNPTATHPKLVVAVILTAVMILTGAQQSRAETNGIIPLPVPKHRGFTLEQALEKRRTIREFSPQVLDPAALSQLLWAAQGITDTRGFRTAPSAGALYPLELDVVVGRVEGISAGVYRYLPQGHRLRRHLSGDLRHEVAKAAWGQHWLSDAPVLFIIRAVRKRTAIKYGKRASLYVPLEAGAVTQNILLQAVSLGLAAATVGAFRPQRLGKLLGGAKQEEPQVIVPVGYAVP
jgi:SagB-type dehydrogenase family enzyme